jgi:hypothetical protein
VRCVDCRKHRQRRERKEIDEWLHDIEDRFRQLAEQSGEGFWFGCGIDQRRR